MFAHIRRRIWRRLDVWLVTNPALILSLNTRAFEEPFLKHSLNRNSVVSWSPLSHLEDSHQWLAIAALWCISNSRNLAVRWTVEIFEWADISNNRVTPPEDLVNLSVNSTRKLDVKFKRYFLPNYRLLKMKRVCSAKDWRKIGSSRVGTCSRKIETKKWRRRKWDRVCFIHFYETSRHTMFSICFPRFFVLWEIDFCFVRDRFRIFRMCFCSYQTFAAWTSTADWSDTRYATRSSKRQKATSIFRHRYPQNKAGTEREKEQKSYGVTTPSVSTVVVY